MSNEQPPPPYGQAPEPGAYGAPHGAPQYSGMPAPTSGSATTSLVLGIVSLLCLGLLSGIPAMIIGRKAVKDIDASRGAIGGRGLAQAGFWTGLAGTVLSILGILAFIALLAAGNSFVDEFEDSYNSSAPAVVAAR